MSGFVDSIILAFFWFSTLSNGGYSIEMLRKMDRGGCGNWSGGPIHLRLNIFIDLVIIQPIDCTFSRIFYIKRHRKHCLVENLFIFRWYDCSEQHVIVTNSIIKLAVIIAFAFFNNFTWCLSLVKTYIEFWRIWPTISYQMDNFHVFSKASAQ